MDRPSAMFLVLVFVFVSYFEEGSCSGKLSVNFRRYENPGGKGDNGHCCDGRSFFCFGACDHRFLVCVDDRDGSSNMRHCPYGRVQTGVVHDADTIVFYSSIGGTRNPILMNFNRWPGSVKIKVYVEDHDDNSNDYVDYLQNVITVTPDKSENTATSRTYVLNRRTRLTVVAKVYCDPHYFGPRCEDYCQPRDDDSGHYTCDPVTGAIICKPGWMGEFCASSHDDCVVNKCEIGATCLDSHQSYICICPAGRTGQYCDQDTDECSNNNICKNNGACINTFGSYSCNCTLAWTGPDCSQAVDFCMSSPCQNGAECQSNESGYHCTCALGWTGSQCEQNVDECLGDPCFHNGTCVDTNGSFQCLCINGTLGNLCEINIDDCASSPCNHSNATCHDVMNGYHCTCPPGITGSNCELNIDECESTPCFYNSTCTDLENGFYCTCINGTTGLLCESNIDECISAPCMNAATCEDLIGQFRCTCAPGYTGSLCEMDINECQFQPCLSNGTCKNTPGSYVCHCKTGLAGKNCEFNINECESNPCLNGGICEDLIAGFNCSCAVGYTGSICDVEINECTPEPCKNNGSCLDKIGTRELFQIEFPMTLDSDEEEIIKNALEDILQENSDHLKDDVNLETSFGTFTSDESVVTTIVSLMVFYKGKQLDQAYLQKILTPDKVEKLRKLVYLHKEDALQLLQKSNVEPDQERNVSQENWAVSHWYAIVIIVMVVILLVLIPVVTHVIRKRKRKVVEMDMNAYWQPNQEAPSLGFENIVYNVEQQPLHANIPTDTDSTTESIAEYTDIEIPDTSCIANGGRMDSFKHRKTES